MYGQKSDQSQSSNVTFLRRRHVGGSSVDVRTAFFFVIEFPCVVSRAQLHWKIHVYFHLQARSPNRCTEAVELKQQIYRYLARLDRTTTELSAADLEAITAKQRRNTQENSINIEHQRPQNSLKMGRSEALVTQLICLIVRLKILTAYIWRTQIARPHLEIFLRSHFLHFHCAHSFERSRVPAIAVRSFIMHENISLIDFVSNILSFAPFCLLSLRASQQHQFGTGKNEKHSFWQSSQA